MPGALEGIRILDLSRGIAGPLTTLLLAEQGADVIRVEPPGGDPFREVYPGYFIWNRSKRSVTLDLEDERDRARFLDLLGTADVLLETFPPGQMARLGLDYERLKERFPGLVYCSLTGYGYDHPWRDRPNIDGLVAARMGLPCEQPGHREGPVWLYFPLPSYGAAFAAAMGIGAALRVRLHTGRGQWLDTSLHDGAALLTSIVWQWAENPTPAFAQRMGKKEPYRPWLYECADGLWLHRMQTAKGNVRVIAQLLGIDPPVAPDGRPAMLAEEARRRWEQDEIRAFKKRPRAEWLRILWENDVPAQPVLPTEEALQDEQARCNGMVAEIDDPERGRVTQIGLPIRMSRTPGAIKGPAPRPGQHNAEVFGVRGTAYGVQNSSAPYAVPRIPYLKAPLDGITVLDFGHYLAGPFGPMLLADLGARVIKVEPIAGEGMRMPSQPFMACQRGKQDIALDLKAPEGLEIAYRLVERADVVHHNHRPGVAERLKIDYATLRALKPDLVYTHAPAYGTHGPRAEMGGYDQLFQAMGGLEYMAGGEGNPPVWVRFGCVDHGDALLSAVGTILALYHRDRTGEGQFVDTSLLNAGLWYNADAFVSDRPDVRRRPTLDRTQTGLAATYRLYETAAGWIAVAAFFEDEWRRFCAAVGKPELARDERFRTYYGRVDHRYALAEVLEPVFKTRTAEEWFQRLDAAGVPCEIANDGYWRTFLLDPWALATGRVVEYYQDDLASNLRQFGKTIRFSETPQVIQGPPPALGAHTRQILTELGYSEAQQMELQAKGVVLDPWPRDAAMPSSV